MFIWIFLDLCNSSIPKKKSQQGLKSHKSNPLSTCIPPQQIHTTVLCLHLSEPLDQPAFLKLVCNEEYFNYGGYAFIKYTDFTLE
jgi:hypothetical protein